ncbi:alpha/beta fold hydrolase [Arthrobacter sp. ISL-48]|uniref:alpha/beta fold hydrolase n=1 Tax=Arthrobacter sp. ISL-48 TaxID=2819110 RepID=UPI001BECDA35|nr:alpha/beta fold hydrolase [Arthrobacter sp. ISL-48]MBT2533648.1 alpha/beta fold hydrolase [Arthrobacter sp. ISL-48]
MKLSGGKDVESGGLKGRLYVSLADGGSVPRATYVLLHGIGVSHRYLARLHQELAMSADVYSFDLPGFGDAPQPRRQVPVGEYAAFVNAALAGAGVRSCVVIGHSMGTQFAVELALQEPGLVAGVVLMGPVVDSGRKSVLAQATALTRDAMFSESLSSNVVVFSDYVRAGPRWYLTELPVMMSYPLESRVQGVSQPVLVMRGSRDPVARHPWCERLSKQAPQGTLVEIPGQGHVFQHTAPRPAAAAISSWVRTVDGFGVTA